MACLAGLYHYDGPPAPGYLAFIVSSLNGTLPHNLLVLLHRGELEEAGQGTAEQEKKFTLRYSIQSKTVRTFLKVARRKGSWSFEEEQ